MSLNSSCLIPEKEHITGAPFPGAFSLVIERVPVQPGLRCDIIGNAQRKIPVNSWKSHQREKNSELHLDKQLARDLT
ncbi:hypothetical protein NDU88_000638 [Pleurodeles waltl]|uniref:Uncharacterized protein n=1 Tax=Pleurodeles waltl TaxID=8319 RepID=A0AAV7TGF5_PLEWA|nr:hypothetical protein NDU88_000638 [Pleurodeles waltl]